MFLPISLHQVMYMYNIMYMYNVHVIIVTQLHQSMGFVPECNYMGSWGRGPGGSHIITGGDKFHALM